MTQVTQRNPTGDATSESGVFELFDASDYILEAELGLSRPIGRRLRTGQQKDLEQTLTLIENTASQLPEGPLKNWSAMLYNRASHCLRQVIGILQPAPAAALAVPHRYSSPAA